MSPVIGVVILVALAVTMVAVAGSFLTGAADDGTPEERPSAAFGFSFEDEVLGCDHLTVSHDGGPAVDPGRTSVVVDGQGHDLTVANVTGEFAAGDRVELPTGKGRWPCQMNGSTARVIWTDEAGEDRYTLAEFEAPST